MPILEAITNIPIDYRAACGAVVHLLRNFDATLLGVAIKLVFSFFSEQFINIILNCISFSAIYPVIPVFDRLPGADDQALTRLIDAIQCLSRDVAFLFCGENAKFLNQGSLKIVLKALRGFSPVPGYPGHSKSEGWLLYCSFLQEMLRDQSYAGVRGMPDFLPG